jgi:MFS transporter, DHA1 family, multidrug resistance protein
VTAAAFIGYTGFTLVMPFLPLYIGQLGARDVGEIAMWSGLSLGVTPALTALLSPAWGRVADRFGRKLMLERALLSFVVVMSLMAFVTEPWQVFALRALQGLFAGYGSLTLAMAAESAPRDRMASAIGLVQTAQRLGPAIGPVLGGLLAGLVGLRRSFFVTAGVYAAAFAVTAWMYREPAARTGDAARPAAAPRFRDILRLPDFGLLLLVIFGIQYGDRSLGPILPLYLERLGVRGPQVPVVAGVLFSVLACAAALGHHLCGRLLGRYRARRIVIAGATVAAVAIGAAGAVTPIAALAAALGLFGVGVGAAMTAAYTAAGLAVGSGEHGTAFGLLAGSALAALAVSPVVSGLIGAWSMPAIFALDAAIAAAAAAAVWWRMSDGRAAVDPPMVIE